MVKSDHDEVKFWKKTSLTCLEPYDTTWGMVKRRLAWHPTDRWCRACRAVVEIKEGCVCPFCGRKFKEVKA